MSEVDVIAASKELITKDRIVADLAALGVRSGSTLMVHAGVSKIGYVSGAYEAVVHALLEALGPEGTLVMPAYTTHLIDPATWNNPPVPSDWWPILRETMTPFDPATSSTRGMSRIADLFRTWPGVKRSYHPHDSVAVHGPLADKLIERHDLEGGFSPTSPIGRLYDLDAEVLLLGVGFECASCLHLAEHHANAAPVITSGAPMTENGARVWKTFKALSYDSDDFEACGAAFEAAHPLKRGFVGQADCRLASIRAAVDFASGWLKENRTEAAKEGL